MWLWVLNKLAELRIGKSKVRACHSVYLNDNASVEAILYEKKNRYFYIFLNFLFSEDRLFFSACKSVPFFEENRSNKGYPTSHGVLSLGKMLFFFEM
jgi:hypothetical protein